MLADLFILSADILNEMLEILQMRYFNYGKLVDNATARTIISEILFYTGKKHNNS